MEIAGLITSMRQLFQDFHAGWYIGLATCLYILINILRGKSGFKVPLITNLYNRIQSKATKTWIILLLFATSGGLITLGGAETSIYLFMDGMLAGLSIGLTAMGTRHAIKASSESNSVQSLKKSMKAMVTKSWIS